MKVDLDHVGGDTFSEDQVITRFMYSGGEPASWLNPPYGTYTTNLQDVEARYRARQNTKYFRLAGQEHVMLLKYGEVFSDGGLSAPTDLRAWLDAWATGVGPWENQQ